jgi:plastocyanin
MYTAAYVSTLDKYDTDKSIADAIISSIEINSPESASKNLMGVIDTGPDLTGKPITVSGESKSDDIGVKTFTINFGATDSQTPLPISPKALSVESGTMVMWINNDNTPHTIVSTSHDNSAANTFYSNKLEPGEKYTLDTTPGVYEFYDPLWPNIRGTLTVIQ